MILIIKTNKETLHDLEFVKPIEDIIKDKVKIVSCAQLNEDDFKKASHIIISGTSLQDNHFVKYLGKFYFLKTTKKPVLGICAGAQLIAMTFGSKINKETEIGYYHEEFTKPFLGLAGKHEVYHLHNNYCTLPKDFDEFTDSKIPQAIKHKTLPIYATLFHPEVRNKELIKEFLKLK